MKNTVSLLALALVTLALVACEIPSKATGGGSIDGYAGSASFGFNADSCDGDVKGRFQYNDHDADVKFNGDVDGAGECDILGCGTFCLGGETRIGGTYESTNPFAPGSGTFEACVLDIGEGSGLHGNAFLYVFSGPYAGYATEGLVSGNVQEHGCN
ncbi:hypothetical protein [Haliangium sp.]|uniref:hypothetical protein n=1 Tax=Haliangium sp. TaxID=2663208 RepID=UPI003D0F8270